MTGLVLEGGGMRGLYSAGVMDVLMQHGFRPDVICGTSAGVTFGVNYPSHQPGRVLRYNLKYAGDKRYISVDSLLRTGDICNVDFCYRQLPDELDLFDYETYLHSGIRLFATLTNVRTGKAEYVEVKDCRTQMDVVRATASLPFLSRLVRYHDEDYLDGGIVDNIPLDKCLEEGCDKVLVVLTRPRGEFANDHLNLLARLFYHRYPALRSALRVRNHNYRLRVEQIERLEAEGRITVLRPSSSMKIARLEHDPSKLRALYELGVRDAQAYYLTGRALSI
ncbi:MAG: patatin family protein [Paludibacteraceae bacterium]|nr:patatin family protein [Paludibacteraceae bacterium]